MIHMLGNVICYLVEVSTQDRDGTWDIQDCEHLLYPCGPTPSFDELISWYQGDLVNCKVEVYEMRWTEFSCEVSRGEMKCEFLDGDSSTGLHGSPIDWREYDGDGVTGEDQEEEED